MDGDGEGEEIGGVVTVDEIAERFRERLTDARPRELERGVTLVGPHRDDATFWLNGLPARITASHGESWSFALALKLAAAELIRDESRTGDPVLILDDVFAELDGSRRARLADSVRDFEQVLVTCAVVTDLPEDLRTDTIRIRAGEIEARDG
jgi:DNA replication and repair protein RecF